MTAPLSQLLCYRREGAPRLSDIFYRDAIGDVGVINEWNFVGKFKITPGRSLALPDHRCDDPGQIKPAVIATFAEAVHLEKEAIFRVEVQDTPQGTYSCSPVFHVYYDMCDIRKSLTDKPGAFLLMEEGSINFPYTAVRITHVPGSAIFSSSVADALSSSGETLSGSGPSKVCVSSTFFPCRRAIFSLAFLTRLSSF